MNVAAEFDVATDNEKFNEYMDNQALGFGLMPLSQALAEAQAALEQPAAAAQQQVSGQKIEEQAKVEEVETDYSSLYLLFIAFIAGALYQLREKKPKLLRQVEEEIEMPKAA